MLKRQPESKKQRRRPILADKLFSTRRKNIIQACEDDYEELANFFSQNNQVHRHLDWFSPLEWVGKEPYLLLKSKKEIHAVLCTVPENKETAWIRVFGKKVDEEISDTWEQMLPKAVVDLRNKGVKLLASLSLHPWFETTLIDSGFEHRQSIVVLEWQNELPDPKVINPQIQIKHLQLKDLPTVAEIDQLAFPPLWQNSLAGLTKAFNQTGISTIAVNKDEIIGYQISTAMTIYGHLARLAVNPDFQRQRIGLTLVYDLLKKFEQRGFWRVTVNTQSDNHASLRLYEKLNFQPTGEEIPVYGLPL